MTTIVFFNNKGGVGKTTLCYHLAHMMARLGWHVLAADLDPQANLTSAFLDDAELEPIWDRDDSKGSIFSAVSPIIKQTGDVAFVDPLPVADRIRLVVGDLALSRFEDRLAEAWPRGFSRESGHLRVTTAFHRVLQAAGQQTDSHVALMDVGPNLGGINRAAIIAADYIVVPLAADLFSLQGLRNLGPTVNKWREDWQTVRQLNQGNSEVDFRLPGGDMRPVGYVVLQHAVRLDRPVKAYEVWLERIPGVYAEHVLAQDPAPVQGLRPDPHCLATLRNYRSLMPYAQEARKPMFDLKPADGAIGGHQKLVGICYEEFAALAKEIAARCGLTLPSRVSVE